MADLLEKSPTGNFVTVNIQFTAQLLNFYGLETVIKGCTTPNVIY